METIKFPITVTSLCLALYLVSAALQMPYAWVFWLFILVNILFVWMVIRILKNGVASEKHFKDYFYEDFPQKRN